MNSGASRLMEPVPTASIERLASELISIPSQAGIDNTEFVLHRMAGWLDAHALRPTFLTDHEGNNVALVAKCRGRTSGASICLNACLDTAPFGDPNSWSFAPTDAAIVANSPRGRGFADSKIGDLIIAHVEDFIASRQMIESASIYLLFDRVERTGFSCGVRGYW